MQNLTFTSQCVC